MKGKMPPKGMPPKGKKGMGVMIVLAAPTRGDKRKVDNGKGK